MKNRPLKANLACVANYKFKANKANFATKTRHKAKPPKFRHTDLSCHIERNRVFILNCLTDRNEVSKNNDRDSSVASLPQNDNKEKAQNDKDSRLATHCYAQNDKGFVILTFLSYQTLFVSY